MVTFGVSLPTYCGEDFGPGITLNELKEWVVTSEKLGFTHFWHVDRVMGKAPPAYNTSWYEPLTVLSAITPFVNRARLGTAIINATYRNPLILAKQLASLDRLSNGKLTIGLGRGWNKAELQACNIPIKERASRFNESVEIITRLLSQKTVNYEGKYWKLNGFNLEPRPVQSPHPPIMIAGGGNGIHFDAAERKRANESVFRSVAKLGDGWLVRTDTKVSEIKDHISLIHRFLPEYGKKPENFLIAHQNFVFVLGKSGNEKDARARFRKLVLRPYEQILSSYIVGTASEVESMIEREVDAGVQHFIVMPVGIDYEVLEFFSKEIMPKFG